MRGTLERLYEKVAKGGELTYAEMTKYNRLQALDKQLTETLSKTASANTRTINRLTETQYEAAFFREGWAIDQASGVELQWGLMRPETIRAAVENPLAKIAEQGMRQNGITGIRRTVTQGLVRGDSYPKMSAAIKKFIEREAGGHMRIVRTEGQRAQVLGQQAAYAQSEEQGVELTEIWDATLDNRTRPAHGELDGRPKDKERDGWYSPDVGWVPGPLQSGDPAFDINCRCRVRAQIAGYEPSVRRVRGEGIVPYKTYETWARQHGVSGRAR